MQANRLQTSALYLLDMHVILILLSNSQQEKRMSIFPKCQTIPFIQHFQYTEHLNQKKGGVYTAGNKCTTLVTSYSHGKIFYNVGHALHLSSA